MNGVMFVAMGALILATGLGILLWVTPALPLSLLGAILLVGAGMLISGALSLAFVRSQVRAVSRTWESIHFDYGRLQEHLLVVDISSISILHQSLLRRPLQVKTRGGRTVLVKGISPALSAGLIRFVEERQAELSAEGRSPVSASALQRSVGAAPTARPPPAPDASVSRWNAATLSDGREVPDGPMIFESQESGIAAPIGAWMSLAPKSNQAMAYFTTALLFAMALALVPPFFGGYVFAGFMVALALAGALLGLFLYYGYHQFVGQSGYSILSLPSSAAEAPAVEAILRAVCVKLGLSLQPLRKRGLWISWSLSRHVTFRFLGPMAGRSTTLALQTAKDENASLHRRLKGAVLETLGTAPVSSPPTRPPAGVQPTLRANVVSAPTSTLRLARPVQPPTISDPPSWAASFRPGEARLRTDIPVPPEGVDHLPPGWWASKPLSARLDKATRFTIWLIAISILFVPALVVASVGIGGQLTLSSLLLVLAMAAILLVAGVGGTVVIAKRERKRLRESHAECFLRIDGGRENALEVVPRIDEGLRQFVPWVRPRPVTSGAAARWEDAGDTLSLTLMAREGRGDALLELRSSRKGPEVAIVKGAVESALFA